MAVQVSWTTHAGPHQISTLVLLSIFNIDDVSNQWFILTDGPDDLRLASFFLLLLFF